MLASFFALLLTTSAFAGDNPKKISKDARDALRMTIVKKFKALDLENMNLKDTDVRVQFLINDENEIIVLRTDNDELDSIVKGTLNYEEVEETNLSRNRLYSINIKLVS